MPATTLVILMAAICGCFMMSTTEARTSSQLRTTSIDSSYGRWNKSSIPYCIDPSYNANEISVISGAINNMQSQLGGACVTFTQVSCTDPRYKLHITYLSNGAGSAPATNSGSNPGVNLNLFKTQSEQILTIARDAQSCSTTPRCVLKYLAIALGKVNEHQRGDRDALGVIVINNANIAVPSAYQMFVNVTNAGEGGANWRMFGYDLCSITHNQPTDYSNGNGPAFTVNPSYSPNFVPQLTSISNTDCKLISLLYNCGSPIMTNCNSIPLCPAQAAGAGSGTTVAGGSTTTVAGGSTTTVAGGTTTTVAGGSTTPSSSTTTGTGSTTTSGTTTTPPPCPNFCTATIDEASMLPSGQYYLFSGTCAQQVTSGNRMIGSPVQISSLMPGVTGPVTAVWMDPSTGFGFVLLKNGTQIVCVSPTTCVPMTTAKTNQYPTFEYTNPSGTYSLNGGTAAPYGILMDPSTTQQQAYTAITGPAGFMIDPSKPWIAAYMVQFGTLSAVSVIGPSTTTSAAAGALVLQTMQWDVPTLKWKFLDTGVLLTTTMGCPPVSG